MLKLAIVLLQVPRILNPVALVVDGLPDLCKDQQVKGYVDSTFGSVEQCRCVLLCCVPYIRHMFADQQRQRQSMQLRHERSLFEQKQMGNMCITCCNAWSAAVMC